MGCLSFQKRFVSLILSGQKVRTTRYRKHAGVKVGNIYKAKTNWRAKEHFALLKVVSIQSADASPHDPLKLQDTGWLKNLYYTIGYQDKKRQRHAEKEGFEDWHEFVEVYTEINAHHRDDMNRKHWIIDFGVVNAAGEFIATKYRVGDWVSWLRDGHEKTAQVLEVGYSEFNQDWFYKIDAFVNDHEGFYDCEMEDKVWMAVNPQID